MSANGLDVFDKTIQTTNIWLNEIMEEVGPDRQVAWKILSTVLHKLRDRLPVDLAAHLGAELPLLVRGVYYDQYEPSRQPTGCRDLETFCAEVGEWLRDTRPVNPRTAVHSVFKVLSRHVSEGQIRKVQDSLPGDIRSSWESVAEGLESPARQGAAGGYLGDGQASGEARPQG